MKPYKLHQSAGSAAPCPEAEALSPPGENADGRVVLVGSNGEMVAHAALWWRETPVVDGRPIGAIGGFSAADSDVATVLLDGAVEQLRKAGCRIAVGPMNGNTWRRHRFVVEDHGRGNFLLEPRNPPEHPAWWIDAGFTILSRYSSSIMPLESGDVVSPGVKVRLERSGVRVRGLDLAGYDEELKKIHSVSLKSFARNFLYTPLCENGFVESYQRIRERVDPDLVKIAERDGVACGFVFGIPDLEAATRSESPAIIVKTLAVDPEARCAGLGSWLVEELHQTGREKGYREAIHALQRETNSSLKITGRHHGEVFRRYALFSKSL